ncbi:hypothetical protein AMTRI_Chr05g66260 [Amborella trichopoda]
MASDFSSYTHMITVDDFDAIVSSDGYYTICGFGSLLSERSARGTFPQLINFRVAILPNFRRIFAHAPSTFFYRGIARLETKELSSLSVEPCHGEHIIITAFEVKKPEVIAFIEREVEFRFISVVPQGLDGKHFPNPAVVCARYSDEEFIHDKCRGNEKLFQYFFGPPYNIARIWRDDIFPCRVYLRHCLVAAKKMGDEVYDNFLDHTFLGDRKTTIREYMASNGVGIMEEELPETVKGRYDG